jgi:hypothetical protein
MTVIITLHRLIDGPLCLDVARQERIEKVSEMAAELVATGSYVDRYDSILVLRAAGHSTFEVHALVADARQIASEHFLAMEMSEP